MPQQADNSGIKRPTANRSCRNCLIREEERHNLRYDTEKHGRAHYETLNLRKYMQDLPKTHKEKLAKKYGLSVHEIPLFDIAPSLNLDSFFPSDPCHSEYAGIAKLAHKILLGSILSPRGQEQYTEELRRLPFPFGSSLQPIIWIAINFKSMPERRSSFHYCCAVAFGKTG